MVDRRQNFLSGSDVTTVESALVSAFILGCGRGSAITGGGGKKGWLRSQKFIHAVCDGNFPPGPSEAISFCSASPPASSTHLFVWIAFFCVRAHWPKYQPVLILWAAARQQNITRGDVCRGSSVGSSTDSRIAAKLGRVCGVCDDRVPSLPPSLPQNESALPPTVAVGVCFKAQGLSLPWWVRTRSGSRPF